jgi:polyhydroxyalkanoate synthesis regulator protein
MRILKRYKNKKVYDTSKSEYINLVQVFDLFNQESLMIQDLEGNEITLSVLYDAINAKKPSPQEAIKVLNKMKDKGFIF